MSFLKKYENKKSEKKCDNTNFNDYKMNSKIMNNNNLILKDLKTDDGISDESKIIPDSNIKVKKINTNKFLFIVHEDEDKKEIGLEIEKKKNKFSFKPFNITDGVSYSQKINHNENLNVEKPRRDNKIIKLLEKATNLSENKLKKDLIKIGIYIEDNELFENESLEEEKKSPPQEDDINSLFENRKNLEKARKMLGELLGEDANIILSKNSHLTYQLDEESNGYEEISFDDIKKIVSNEIGEYNTNDRDVEIALTHIDKRLTPEYNIVKFNNCLFDMEKLEKVERDEPVFTLIGSDYNYNPEAKSELIKEFLYSSLNRSSEEETEKEVQKILEIIGYLFTSGNKKTILPIIVGIGGSGKSVLLNLIIKIFGTNKTADLKLQDMATNHGTASLLGKHLNVIRDSDDSMVENIGILKQLTGYDDLQVNPKFKDAIIMDKDEVPKNILVANKIPRFKSLDSALLDRIIVIEFKHKFRGTEHENKDLFKDILDNDEEMEWLIYSSIEAYKNMIDNTEEFLAKESHEKTELILNKHTKPLNYLVSELVTDNTDEDEISEGNVFTNSLNDICIKLAEKEGLDITSYISNGKIKSKSILNTIRSVFEFWDNDYSTKVGNTDGESERYYPDIYKIKSRWNELNKE